MRTTALLGLVGLLAVSSVVGCASEPTEEGADTSNGAATATANKISSGVYDGELQLVVRGTQVEGSYFSSIGDPAHGGATCSFTIAGYIETVGGVDRAHISATDASSVTGGELVAMPNGDLNIKLNASMNACDRSSPVLHDTAGLSMSKTADIGADVQGYRTVQAAKTFFYDRAGGNPRAAYVMQSDAVVVTGTSTNGFTPVKYVGETATTKGFLKAIDLTATFAPAPGDTFRGSFVQDANVSTEGNFEVIRAANGDMIFNLSVVNKYGGFNMGDVEMGHAKVAGNVATWQGDGCTVTLKFAADGKTAEANQEGQCADFGHNVFVGGTFTRQ